MTQERVMAQVKPRLQHCLEQKDHPGILALTTWLVHRHGYPLLQQLLSQPEWSSHRLWWGEQIGHPNPKTGDKVPMAAKGTSDPLEVAPSPQQRPEPQDGLHLGGRPAHPASRTEPLDQTRDDVKLTPAQVTKQRLKLGKPAPIQEDEEVPRVAQAASKERSPRTSPVRQHRSLRLRDWLPRNRLPHQDVA